MSCGLIIQYLLPKYLITKLAAKIAACQIPFIKNWLIKNYVKYYQINTSEISKKLEEYRSLGDFFSRALTKDARKIAEGNNIICSPVDGTLREYGKIIKNQLFTIKGKSFTLDQLLAVTDSSNSLFNNGEFTILYLSPKDYHRIHLPTDGKLTHMHYVPGTLFSVNPELIETYPDILAKNERLIIDFDTNCGKMAIIMVGAVIAGSIETTWHGTIKRSNTISQWDFRQQELSFKKGEEIGAFRLGSTVILLFTPNTVTWNQSHQVGQPIKMGQPLATAVN